MKKKRVLVGRVPVGSSEIEGKWINSKVTVQEDTGIVGRLRRMQRTLGRHKSRGGRGVHTQEAAQPDWRKPTEQADCILRTGMDGEGEA